MEETRRLLILNYEFPPLGGGGGVAAKTLAKGFIKNGYIVDYITTWYPGLELFEVVDGINVYRIKVWGRKNLATASLLSLVTFPLLAYRTASALCQKNHYTFINTHFAVPTGPLGIWISKKFKIKNILSIHGGDIYDPTKVLSPHRKWYLRAVINWVLKNSDEIVAQSTNTKDNALKHYRPNKQIKVIPLPYEPYIFATATRTDLGLKDELFYSVSVGRLVKRKGFDLLIRSVARIEEESIHALIIGDGPERDNLTSLARELGVEHRIHFLGRVSEDKKFQYLANANVYVLSSIHEGFGIVLQEAMQVSLPLISTNNGGQCDVVVEGVNGFLIESDSNELADKIVYMKSSGFTAKGNIGRYSANKIAQEYTEL